MAATAPLPPARHLKTPHRAPLKRIGFRAALQKLQGEGVCILRGALEPDLAGAVLAEAEGVAQEARSLPEEAARRWAPIHSSSRLRHDVAVPLVAPVRRAVELLARRLAPLLRAVLGQDTGALGATLVELGAVTSQPGAAAQLWHADVDLTGEDEGAAAIFAVFLALHDIDDAMGPTEVLPGTHTAEFHASVRGSARPRGLVQRRPVFAKRRGVAPPLAPGAELLAQAAMRLAPRAARGLAPLRAGDAAVMDAACFHRGGANRSSSPRTLLHFAIMAGGSRPPKGFTYTIVPEATNPWLTLDALARPRQLHRYGLRKKGQKRRVARSRLARCLRHRQTSQNELSGTLAPERHIRAPSETQPLYSGAEPRRE